MTTGERIKQARRTMGVTQQELADRLGISYVGVSQWETDKRKPKQETLVRIANALGVPASSLCGPDRYIPNFELRGILSELLNQARDNREKAMLDNDFESQRKWENVARELEEMESQAVNAYRDLPEDASKLVELFFQLNDTGKRKVLELVSDFCKIPAYQAIPAPSQQESPQNKQ